MPYRRIVSLCVIAAPAIFLVGNILHPKEYTRGHEAQQLQRIADHYTRWQFVHFLTYVAIVLFVVVVVGLAWLLIERRPTQAVLGGALGLFGLVSIAGVLALDGFTWGVLGEVSAKAGSDAHTVQTALHDIQQSEWNLPFYVGALSWLIGLVTLTTGLIREGVIPAPAGWTFAAGAVLVGVEAGIENNVYFIVAAVVLALGGLGVGTAIGRLDDQELAT